MASRFSATSLDLSRIDPAALFQPLSFETIRRERLDDLKARMKAAGIDWDVDAIEADPGVLLQEAGGYRELLTRQAIRDAQLDVLLAFSRGQWLDRMGDLYGVARMEIAPADALAGTPAIMEDDDRYRARIQLAPEAYGAAGTLGGYLYHVMSSSPDVHDAAIHVIDRGTPRVTVEITVMAISGVPSSTTMEAVRRTIFAENVKLATDVISLRSAVAVPYEINAKVFVQPGPDPSLIRQQAIASVSAAAGRYRRLAGGVPASALISALQVAGVDGATLLSPPGGVRTERWQFGDLTKIDVEVACLNDRGVTQWQ